MSNEIYFQYIKHHKPTHDEFKRITDFYLNHKDSKVRDRPESVMQAAYENRQILYAEDANSKIIASSGTFSYLGETFWEAGADRVILNGFGIQGILQTIRAMNTYVMTPCYEDYFALHSEGNVASEKSLTKVGFIPWDPPPNLLAERSKKLNITSPTKVVYYHLNKNSYKTMAKFLLSIIKKPLIERDHGVIELNFSRIRVFQDKDYLSYLEKIAS